MLRKTEVDGAPRSERVPCSTPLLLMASVSIVLLAVIMPLVSEPVYILAALAIVVVVYLISRNGLISLILFAPIPMLSYYSGILTLRPIHLVLLITYVAWLFRYSLHPRPIRTTYLLLLLALWVLFSLASSVNALNKLVVVRGSASIALLMAILLYILNHIRDMRHVFLAVKALLFTSALVIGYGLYQFLGFYMGWRDFVRAIMVRLPLNPYYLDIIAKQQGISRETINFINIFPRPTSFLGDPNFLSGYVTCLLPVAVCLFILAMARKRIMATVFLGLYILSAFFLEMATFSRSGLIALAVALLVTLLLVGTERRYLYLLVLSLLVVGVSIVLMLMLSDLMPLEAYVGRFVGLSHLLQANPFAGDTYRMQTIAAGLKFFQRHPILGVGTGNFGENFSAFAGGSTLGRGQFTPVTILAENGLLGLTILSGVVLGVLWKARWILRLRRGGRQAVSHLLAKGLFSGFCGLVVSNMLYEYYTLEFVWVYLAVFVASAEVIRQEAKTNKLGMKELHA